MNKLELLKRYINLQANDSGLWFQSESVTESYLQQELRHIAFLIEDANEEEIMQEIEDYKARI